MMARLLSLILHCILRQTDQHLAHKNLIYNNPPDHRPPNSHSAASAAVAEQASATEVDTPDTVDTDLPPADTDQLIRPSLDYPAHPAADPKAAVDVFAVLLSKVRRHLRFVVSRAR